VRLIATTVVRKSKQRITGFIYEVDWRSREVVARLPVPEPRYPEADDNPRGGVRGGRGVAVTQHGVVVANYDTLYRYDEDWNVLDELSHPLFSDIHEIAWDGEHLWVTATGIDAVLRVSLDGEVRVGWDPYASPLAGRLGIGKRQHAVDGSLDYRIGQAPLLNRCHVNGVARQNGAIVVNFGLVRTARAEHQRWLVRIASALTRHDGRGRRFKRPGRSMVARIGEAQAAEILLDVPPHIVPWHNGQLLDDAHVVVNDSTTKTLRVFEVAGGREVKSLHLPGKWLRGLVPIDAARVFVGSAPAAVALVDLDAGQVEGRVQLSEKRKEAVHGLAVRLESA
jgi:hypothetical protein